MPVARKQLLVLAGCVVALLISPAAFAQSGVTGNWSGTYNYSITVSSCSNKTYTSSGNTTVTLMQTGTSITGRMDIANFLAFNNSCSPSPTEVTTVIVGTVNGSAIALSVPNDSNVPQFSGSVSGNTIALDWTDANGGTGAVQLTRVAGDAPSVDVTGTWTGNYNFTDRCSNGKTQSYAGPVTMGLAQSGSNAGGVLAMQSVPLYDQNCSKITTLDMAMVVGGSVSGSTFTGGVVDPSGSFEFPINSTISSNAMNGTVNGASATNTTGTFTLTRSDSSRPASDFSGSYEGSYTEADNETFTCLNIGTLQFSGDASLSIVQAGSTASGWLTFHDAEDVASDGFGNCFVVGVGDSVLPISGFIVNNVLTTTVPLGSNVAVQIKLTLGDAITGTVLDSFGDQAVFNVARTASAPAPVITRFAVVPAAIVPGQPATLSWSTTDATSVSIDNGVGSQAANGSINVSPSTTTQYTLTATGPGGSATGKATVTVFAPGSKRRAVKP